MNLAEWTFVLAVFNSAAVPLLLAGRAWTRRVERRLARLERHLNLEPIHTQT